MSLQRNHSVKLFAYVCYSAREWIYHSLLPGLLFYKRSYELGQSIGSSLLISFGYRPIFFRLASPLHGTCISHLAYDLHMEYLEGTKSAYMGKPNYRGFTAVMLHFFQSHNAKYVLSKNSRSGFKWRNGELLLMVSWRLILMVHWIRTPMRVVYFPPQ